MALMLAMGDAFAVQILVDANEMDDLKYEGIFKSLENIVSSYTDALERVLGCASGSLQIIDMDTVKEWLITPEEAREALPLRDNQ
jgi:hypothetical protein